MKNRNPSTAEWLSRELDRTGLTIAEISRLAGISPQTAFRVLSGRSRPSDRTISRLVTALAVSSYEYAPTPELRVLDGRAGVIEAARVDELDGLLARLGELAYPSSANGLVHESTAA